MSKNVSGSGRDKWSTGFGFIMSAAGSAVGLGNIWKFPYVCGTGGGALFLAVYIFFVLVLGYPILLTELSVGRHGGSNAVDACEKIKKGWGFAGGFGVAGSAAVLAYYCTVGGWVMKYLFSTASGNIPLPSYFSEYSTMAAEPVVWQTVFLLINGIIVVFGVSKGIEKVSSVLLPLLLVFLVGLMIYSLTLNGAAEGVKFLLLPDFSKISSFGDVADIVVKAMGQVFFSLSLGMGTLITYGSYLEEDNDLSRSTWIIVTIDTAIAMISGLTVLPAVFAMGLEPDEGAGLIFSTLTAVFGGLSYGRIAGTVFFALVLFAAITSSISLLETIVSFLTERYGLSRLKATVIPVIIIGLLCVPASLSYGVLSDVGIFGLTVFELFVFLSDQIIMPLGGFFLCILAGRIWGRKNMEREISSDGRYPFRLAGVFDVMIKYLSPAMIIIVFVSYFIR